jgi:hypothetical protein
VRSARAERISVWSPDRPARRDPSSARRALGDPSQRILAVTAWMTVEEVMGKHFRRQLAAGRAPSARNWAGGGQEQLRAGRERAVHSPRALRGEPDVADDLATVRVGDVECAVRCLRYRGTGQLAVESVAGVVGEAVAVAGHEVGARPGQAAVGREGARPRSSSARTAERSPAATRPVRRGLTLTSPTDPMPTGCRQLPRRR